MKRHVQEQLLNELLAGEETAEFRNASLAHALEAMRHDRRHHRALCRGLIFAAVLVAASVWLNNRSGRVSTEPERVALKPANPPRSETKDAPIKYISDDELFALFPDRAMALIGKPGAQQLVFLKPKAGSQPKVN